MISARWATCRTAGRGTRAFELVICEARRIVDDEEPQLINQEVDSRRGVPLEDVHALIEKGVSGV